MRKPPEMEPAQFGSMLALLAKWANAIALMPLDEMADYIDYAERMTDHPATSEARRADTLHAARVIAAAKHLRETAQAGGAPIVPD